MPSPGSKGSLGGVAGTKCQRVSVSGTLGGGRGGGMRERTTI